MSTNLNLRRQRGVSMVELMVAITIGIILSSGIVQLFQSSKQSYRLQEARSIVNENARFAVNHLQHDLRLAAHWGGVRTSELTALPSATNTVITNDCGPNWAIEQLGIQGYEGAAAPPLPCIDSDNYVPGSDVIAVRAAASEQWEGDCANPLCASRSGALFVRSAVGRRAVIFRGPKYEDLPNDLKPSSAPTTELERRQEMAAYPTHPLDVSVFYLRPCAQVGNDGACAEDSEYVPTLVHLTLNPDRDELIEEDIVAGVEQMQVRYGVDTDGDLNGDRYLKADVITADNQWDRVVSARITLLIREEQRDPTFTDGETVVVDDEAYTIPERDRSYRRRIYSTVVQLRNQTRA